MLGSCSSNARSLSATLVTGSLMTNEILPNLALLDPHTKIHIDSGSHVSFVDPNGSFKFNLQKGIYALTVISSQFIFLPIRLHVTNDSVLAFSLHPEYSWEHTGPLTSLQLAPVEIMDYFQQPAQFSILSIFSNPMTLMMCVTLLIVMVMPKLQAQVDAAKALDASNGEVDTSRDKQEKIVEKVVMPEMGMPDISANIANWFIPAAIGDNDVKKKRGNRKNK